MIFKSIPARFAAILSMVLLTAMAARAETLLLLHGHQGSWASWRTSGATAALAAQGWQDRGTLAMGPAGIVASPAPAPSGHNFYTLELPDEAPVGEQARILSAYVGYLKARDEDVSIILAGHSAGGVVARMYMVVSRDPSVRTLITVASPNLGSSLADMGSRVSNSPLGWFAPAVGAGSLSRSGALYRDLGRENPYNLLGWLNRQPHPEARYVAVIRSANGTPSSGDGVSEAWRQDLRFVPALGQRAEAVVTPAGHGLQPADGALIGQILRPASGQPQIARQSVN